MVNSKKRTLRKKQTQSLCSNLRLGDPVSETIFKNGVSGIVREFGLRGLAMSFAGSINEYFSDKKDWREKNEQVERVWRLVNDAEPKLADAWWQIQTHPTWNNISSK